MGYNAGDGVVSNLRNLLTAGFLQGFADFLYTVEEGDGGEDQPGSPCLLSNAHTVLELYFGKGCIEMIDPKGTNSGERNATGDWYSTLNDTTKSYMATHR